TPDEENYESRQDMLNELLSLFGGRVAEAVALGDISTGASNDLQHASEICRNMVKRYGMTDAIGPVVYDEGNNQVFLGKDYGQVNNYSEETGARIDAEVERLMREAYEKTESILRENYDKLELVALTLIEREKLTGEEFKALMTEGKLPETEEESPAAVEEVPAETVETETSEAIEAEEVTEAAEADEAPEENIEE
ncbi:MAG: ATP-dependent zinc metalloprotease FtsH, partial [Eubacterium sp.]|nr:ATP-dependent zinc metalloprotease FtsH [Eubacterium sp.]